MNTPTLVEPTSIHVDHLSGGEYNGKIRLTVQNEDDTWCFFLPKTSSTLDVAVDLAAHIYPRPPTDSFKRHLKERLGFDTDPSYQINLPVVIFVAAVSMALKEKQPKHFSERLISSVKNFLNAQMVEQEVQQSIISMIHSYISFINMDRFFFSEMDDDDYTDDVMEDDE